MAGFSRITPSTADFSKTPTIAKSFKLDAVYQSGEVAFLFLDQSSEFSTYDAQSLRALARQVIADHDAWFECNSLPGYDYDDWGCEFGVLWIPGHSGDRLLPPMSGYDDIVIRLGGAEALNSEPSWASLRKLWPADVQGTQAGSAVAPRSASTQFDLTDLDLSELPPVECGSKVFDTITSCHWWERHPELGVAGFHSEKSGKNYIQIKILPGEDTKAADAKAALVSLYDFLDEDNLVIVPVDYDYADLWRARDILDRFTWSAANTMGVYVSQIVDNAYPLVNGLVYTAGGPGQTSKSDLAERRQTLLVITHDVDATIAALPRLLPQLGISENLVGIVAPTHFEAGSFPEALMGTSAAPGNLGQERGGGSRTDPDEGPYSTNLALTPIPTIPPPDLSSINPKRSDGDAIWLWIGVGAVAAVIGLGVVVKRFISRIR